LLAIPLENVADTRSTPDQTVLVVLSFSEQPQTLSLATLSISRSAREGILVDSGRQLFPFTVVAAGLLWRVAIAWRLLENRRWLYQQIGHVIAR
jgi:hypothetical protein